MKNELIRFFKGPDLPPETRHTYRRHMAQVFCQATAEGILANAPVIALMGLGSPNWQMALEKTISSIGLFAVIYFGGLMAVRKKMPFFFYPGMGYAICALLMGMTENPFLFLTMWGCGTLFDNMVRPAMAAIERFNYPVENRGAIAGEVRKWSNIVFLCSVLLSAALLQIVADEPKLMIKIQMLTAAGLLATGCLIFRTIKVKEDLELIRKRIPVSAKRILVDSYRIVRNDVRFLRYLAIGFFDSFGGMVSSAFIPVLLTQNLKFSYIGTAVLIHIIPCGMGFLNTGYLGQWIDKVSTWKSWGWIRLGWAADSLFLAAAYFAVVCCPAIAPIFPFLSSISRGAIQGGSYILWWEVGVNHFAPPGGDTSRYMGIILFLTGLSQFPAPALGAWLITSTNVGVVMLVGGAIELLSSALSFREHHREQQVDRLETMTTYEHSFD